MRTRAILKFPNMSIFRQKYNADYFENGLHKAQPHSQRNATRLRTLLEYKQEGDLLEIGCGTGNFLSEACSEFAVSGLEISKYAAKEANQKPCLKHNVKIGNVEATPLLTAAYDVIVAFNVLEHLASPQPVIKNIYQALKPDGILIGSVPNNSSLVGTIATKIGNYFDKTHRSTLNPSTWMQYFSNKFSQVDFFGEIPCGRNHCLYIHQPYWPYCSINLVFVCRK